jgi:excisionase family DNA binding protein
MHKTLNGIYEKYWTPKELEGTLRPGISQSEVFMPSDQYGVDDRNPLGKKPPASAGGFVPERLLDSDEAAKIMNVHPKTLQKLARKGLVRGVHVGKLWRFRASTIEDWIQSQLAS